MREKEAARARAAETVDLEETPLSNISAAKPSVNFDRMPPAYKRFREDLAAAGLSEAEFLARAHSDGNGQERRGEKKQETSPELPVKDYGHASVLAEYFQGRYRWAPHRGSWMEWTGKVWQAVEDEYTAKVAADTLRTEYAVQLAVTSDRPTIRALTSLIQETCIFARITGALSFLKGWPGILTRFPEWDPDPWALNVGTGIIGLTKGEEADEPFPA